MNDDAQEVVLRRRLGELAGLARATPRKLPSAGTPQTGKSSWHKPRSDQQRRRRVVLVGPAAGLALLGALATVWVLRAPNAPAGISSITDTVPPTTTTAGAINIGDAVAEPSVVTPGMSLMITPASAVRRGCLNFSQLYEVTGGDATPFAVISPTGKEIQLNSETTPTFPACSGEISSEPLTFPISSEIPIGTYMLCIGEGLADFHGCATFEVLDKIGTTEPATPGAVQTIPESPLAERAAAAIASIDDQLLVWGGSVPNHLDGSEPPYADGAIFDRSVGNWRTVAPSPLPGGIASAIGLDDTMVVLNAGRVAAYNPADDTWTEVPPPVSDGLNQLVRLGDEIVVLPAAVAWSSRGWRQLAAPPVFEPTSRAVSYADSIITWGPTAGSQTGDTWRYDATADQWAQLPNSPLTQVYEGSAAVVLGDELIVVSWADMGSAALNLNTLSWRRLPSLPLLSVKCWVDAAVVDATAIVSMCGDYAVLDEATSTWSTLRSPATAHVWAHTDLVSLGQDLVLSGRVIVAASFWTDGPSIGPVPVGSATVDRDQVANVALVETAGFPFQVVAELNSGCTLSTATSSPAGQLTLSDALAAEPAATTVEFWDELYGNYRLTCPDANRLRAAAGSITTPFE